jgi:hypothetical protein
MLRALPARVIGFGFDRERVEESAEVATAAGA